MKLLRSENCAILLIIWFQSIFSFLIVICIDNDGVFRNVRFIDFFYINFFTFNSEIALPHLPPLLNCHQVLAWLKHHFEQMHRLLNFFFTFFFLFQLIICIFILFRFIVFFLFLLLIISVVQALFQFDGLVSA